MNRSGTGWQLILADLALILFLVALIALIGRTDERAEEDLLIERRSERARADTVSHEAPGLAGVAPAHGVYRPAPGAPPIGDWLADQALDTRAVLTILARHEQGARAEAWARALALAREAQGSGVPVRIVTEEGDAPDLSATLAFDAAPRSAAAPLERDGPL